MIRRFPEIEEFFNKEIFSDIDLMNFKKELFSKYSKEEVKKCEELIQLKLLSFQLGGGKDVKKPSSKKVNKKVRFKTQTIKPKRINFKEAEFIGLTIDNLATKLNTKGEIIERILESKKFEVDIVHVLTSKEVKALKDFIIDRLKKKHIKPIISSSEVVHKKSKKKKGATSLMKKKKLKPGPGKSKGFDVYDKLQTYGRGKIIYTRMGN